MHIFPSFLPLGVDWITSGPNGNIARECVSVKDAVDIWNLISLVMPYLILFGSPKSDLNEIPVGRAARTTCIARFLSSARAETMPGRLLPFGKVTSEATRARTRRCLGVALGGECCRHFLGELGFGARAGSWWLGCVRVQRNILKMVQRKNNNNNTKQRMTKSKLI